LANSPGGEAAEAANMAMGATTQAAGSWVPTPPHPPRPLPSGSPPVPLSKMAGHADQQRHGFHLFGIISSLSLHAAGRSTFRSPNKMGMQPLGHASHTCSTCVNSLTPKSVLAGMKNSRWDRFWLAKHKHKNISTMIEPFPPPAALF